MGQVKWTFTRHTTDHSLPREGDGVYMGDWKGILCYELLLESQAINSTKYCSRWDQLRAALRRLHPGLGSSKHALRHQDNARPYVYSMTRQRLSWEVLVHPPYSPDLTPSDFYLSSSLQNSFNGKNFKTLEDCKRHLGTVRCSKKDKTFWEDGIMKLPEKWQKVVEQNGEYIVQ